MQWRRKLGGQGGSLEVLVGHLVRGGEGQCIKNPATTTGGTKKQIRQPGSGQQARRALLVARESFYFDV